MGKPELSPYQKYQNFIKTNASCKNLSPAETASIMLRKNLLTPTEYAQLKQNSIIFSLQFYDRNNTVNPTKQPTPVASSTQPVQQYHHPLAEEIICDKDGKVDMSQFSVKNLKQKYPAKDYNVKVEKVTNASGTNDRITVTTKKGAFICSISKNSFGTEGFNIEVFFRTLNGCKNVTISEKSKKIIRYTETEEKQDKIIRRQYNADSKYPIRKWEDYPDGSYKITNYDDKTGKKQLEQYWKKDANTAEYVTFYTNNKPWKKLVGKKEEYPLANDLIKGLEAKSVVGSPTTGATLVTDILHRITPDNAYEVLKEFEKRTGINLIERLKKEYTMNTKYQHKCIHHLESLLAEYGDKKENGKYIANELFNDIRKGDKNHLKLHTKLINQENIKNVLVEYRHLSLRENFEQECEFQETMDTVKEYLPEALCTKLSDFMIKKVTPYQGLLEAIHTADNISAQEKKELINHIINTAMEDKSDYAKKQAKSDIKKHPNDYHKVEVDLYRVQNTESGDLRNPDLDQEKPIKETEGLLSANRKQGRVGDCWLIAAINAIVAKPQMLAKLDSQIKFDKKTGNYTITLKGAKKEYTVTSKEIDEATTLSAGSRRLRAIEIAMDKYIRDNAYKNKHFVPYIDKDFDQIFESVDINGNHSSFLWQTLFGQSSDIEEIDPQTENFSNPNVAYCFSLKNPNNDYNGSAINSKGEKCTIHKRHAYSIVGSDKDNIYFVNPWDSSDKIKMTREEFAKMGVRIESFKI